MASSRGINKATEKILGDETVTKKNPKTTIIIDERMLVGIEGIIAIKITRITLPTKT